MNSWYVLVYVFNCNFYTLPAYKHQNIFPYIYIYEFSYLKQRAKYVYFSSDIFKNKITQKPQLCPPPKKNKKQNKNKNKKQKEKKKKKKKEVRHTKKQQQKTQIPSRPPSNKTSTNPKQTNKQTTK